MWPPQPATPSKPPGCLGAAAGIRERIGVPVLEPERADVEQAAAMARGALGGEAFARAHQQGRTLDLNQMLNHPVG